MANPTKRKNLLSVKPIYPSKKELLDPQKKQPHLKPLKLKTKQAPKEAIPPKRYPGPDTREGLSFAIEK